MLQSFDPALSTRFSAPLPAGALATQALADGRSNIRQFQLVIDRAEKMLVSSTADPEPASVTASQPGLPGQGGLAPWQVKVLLGYFAAHLDSKITTQQLAAMARLSPFYFARAFKTTFGDSPHRYLLQRRMEHSQGLMLNTSATLADIALDCGLVDQAHFGKLFRRLVGESPAAWRRARASVESPFVATVSRNGYRKELVMSNDRNVPANAMKSHTARTLAI